MLFSIFAGKELCTAMRFKLRETPESPTLPTRPGQPGGGHLVFGGYGKNAWGLDNPQPSSREGRESFWGEGSTTRWARVEFIFGLRYSLAPPRGGPWQSSLTRGGPEPRGVRAKSTDPRGRFDAISPRRSNRTQVS